MTKRKSKGALSLPIRKDRERKVRATQGIVLVKLQDSREVMLTVTENNRP